VTILHILKSTPDASTVRIIEVQAKGNRSTVVDLTRDAVDYDKLIADVFDSDKVMCW